MLTIDQRVLEISLRDSYIYFSLYLLQRDFILSKRVGYSQLSYFKRLISKSYTFYLYFYQKLQYRYIILIPRSIENRELSSSTIINVRIIFLALGIPGQNNVYQSKFSYLQNSSNSRSYQLVLSYQRLMKSFY